MNNLKNLRGTVDLLPDQLIKWQNVEKIVLEQLKRSSIKEIRTPILEMTELFIRGIGEGTDVVSKEMYTFLDRGERSCTLRPEGTASVARALIQNGISSNPLQKLWYMGPMFRYERPQAGRQRQFHQLGVEFIGYESVRSDVEIIALAWDILKKLGIKELNLEINTLGDLSDRLNFQENFLKWLKTNKKALDLDSQNRIDKNPLRIFDSKNIQTKKILENAPRLIDFLSEKSRKRYSYLKKQLEILKIPYLENLNLVRGLDYYTHTAFEITSGSLGSQATVCGGGRYDDLIKQMGGPSTPAIGFAIGLERLILLAGKELEAPRNTDIYIINQGLISETLAMDLSRKLRNYDLLVELDLSGASFSKQFKKANKLKAKSIIVIGDDEAANKEFIIRLFDKASTENKELAISFEDDITLEKWLINNLLVK
ncbi:MULTISPECIES: histidine--tRNA ligase [Prochlorococcus]|uniref:Histidine--tRNA ligase n=1 Tax=Prochlorococcus marinus str. MIT 9116 TaxID=167544 RepID=A0A0A1ZV43_PROMR|nr:histidine--tRNA ligase [Prochlorococcus marinus]KGF90909.1 Histidyl-tRNA synthetase [Prochlorococcus marinus str. MIT 9107]KGF92013.1 Histidyl-tRNA synthetase [Prochlorococcus marinus str. MIT 9116]KGF93394.1 Histidyl-tRNA synthetase [Prochlorococcus marinus str. MIT 9123]